MCSRRGRSGFSLIEVVVFIVVIGIAVAALALLYNQTTRASVDPLIRKQALALAASLLEEVELQPFTFCDPDDAAVTSAANAAACATPENIGVEGGETRYASPPNPRFDNVSDYHAFAMGSGQADPNIRTIADPTPIAALADYSVVVAVTAPGASELGGSVPPGEQLRITVTATHVPTGISVSLDGYRTRYAPNSP